MTRRYSQVARREMWVLATNGLDRRLDRRPRLARARGAGLAATLLAVLVASVAHAPHARAAEACTPEEFASAVDEAGERLRAFNTQALPDLKARLKQLKTAKGWTDADYEQKGLDFLHDARIAGLDAKANELLVRVDALGRVEEGGKPDCNKLTELRAAALELLAVMKTKSSYTLAKIDAEISPDTAPAESKEAEADKNVLLSGRFPKDIDRLIDLTAPENGSKPVAAAEPAKSQTTVGAVKGTRPAERAKLKPAEPARKPATPSQSSTQAAKKAVENPAPWRTSTARDPIASNPAAPDRDQLAMNAPVSPGGEATPTLRPPAANGPPPPAGALPDLPVDAMLEPPGGYTIEEVRAATRGFFGTISTSLASVLEHAFKTWGQPTAYVLGEEGGGAFLAGLRYGRGTLFPRFGESRKIYWHGPSVGYDFGAAGSRTMFLIYKMEQPEDLYRSFTGVDGSAFIVGGVGLTVLKGGPIVMTPIRTGLGLRIGANIGYIRFTPEPTWNPF